MREAPIFHFNDERSFIVEEVVGRVTRAASKPLYLLNDTAWCEVKRLEASPGHEREKLGRYRDLARSVGKLSESEQRLMVETLAREYARDVCGNFDRRVYSLTTRALPGALAALLSPKDFSEGFQTASRLQKHLVVQGPIETVRALAQRGSVVFVPTHLSNLDSVVFGFALEREGLPPVSYGAGKNLFTNPFLAFFMRNLGAYRVDRRIRHELYKEVLKTYSTVLLERGYHSLFFPGGTRSRSGLVEEHLKLGLLGTGLDAFVNSLRRGREHRVFFVPATINYLLTLEASTLIADYLAEVGRNRYIIDDDESTQLERIFTLLRKMVMTTGSVVIRFGHPIDPFTNRVTSDGRSVDSRGRTVEPSSYVTLDGHAASDPQRDMQYTRELGESLCKAFAHHTVAMSTHLVAAAAFARLRETFTSTDLFSLLRRRDEVFVPHDDLRRRVEDLVQRARDLEDQEKIVLAPGVRNATADDLILDATRAWSGYHSHPVLSPTQNGWMLSDPNLLLYYQNRLAVSGLGFHPAPRART